MPLGFQIQILDNHQLAAVLGDVALIYGSTGIDLYGCSTGTIVPVVTDSTGRAGMP